MGIEQIPKFEKNIAENKKEIMADIHETKIDKENMEKSLDSVINALENEQELIRPKDKKGRPGGIVELKKNISTLIIPDLHGRKEFLIITLLKKDERGRTNLDKMLTGELQVVCLGDGMHTEAKGARGRWMEARQESVNDFAPSPNMDEEMLRSFGTMKLVMDLKENCPEGFHYLKGNHDNILNEEDNGNYPFTKFANEGALVKTYLEKKYDQDFLNKYARFEKNLPIIALGTNFVVSHAEPKSVYSREELINYRGNPEVIKGLTWTDNDEAEQGSVEKNLKNLLNKENIKEDYYFGGHRHVPGKYSLRADGRYVQINNLEEMYVALVSPDKKFDLENDIYNVSPLAVEEKKEKEEPKDKEEKILRGEKFDFTFPGKPVDIYLGPKHLQIISVKNDSRFNIDYLLIDPNTFDPDNPKAGGYKGLWEDQPIILGRGNPYRFELPNTVSHKHAIITVHGDKFEIIDLNSLNGTRIEV